MKTTKQGIIKKKIDARTVVVETFRMKVHPLYKKRYKIVKKYLADDRENKFNEGDIVVIEECRPISKTKRFKVLKKVGEKSLLGGEKLKGEEVLEKKEVDRREEIKNNNE